MLPTSIALFAAHQTQRGLSRRTVERRTSSLSGFAAHCAPLPITEASTALVEEWLAGFRTPATRSAYRKDLVAFYRWACRRGVADHDPTLLTDPVKVPRSLPRPVPAAVVRQLIASADTDTAAMIGLAVFAGLRRSEIAGLQRTDLNLWADPPTIIVRNGKGGKDRVIPAHPDLVGLLISYRGTGPVFHIGSGAIANRITHHLHQCGVDATTHQLRHTFGTEFARVSHGNIVQLAGLMGHASIDTTMGYVGWAGTGADVVARMYPIAA